MAIPGNVDNLEYIPEEEASGSRVPAQPAKQEPAVSSPTTAVGGEPGSRLLRLYRLLQKIKSVRHAVKAVYLRVIGASNDALQRLRNRAEAVDVKSPPALSAGRPTENRKAAVRKAASDAKAPELTQAPRSKVRGAFILVLGMVVSGIAGMLFSYTLLSTMVVNQALKIDDQMDEISQFSKQYSRVQTSAAEYRQEIVACQRQVDDLESRLAGRSPGQQASAPQPTSLSHQSGPHGKASRAGIRGEGAVDCHLGSGDIPGDLSRCINNYNGR